ncbi:MAG: peptide ABC transporter substrate-binding protein [Rectinema sp.]|nr:peptide ABC transporter substrate-binding protein [Rectinema sp.]
MNSRRRSLLLFLVLIVSFCLPTTLFGTEEDEFVTVFNAQLPQLDPQRALFSNEAQIHTALYEGLFSYDPQTLEPVKALAESWSRSTDGTIYRFIIRQNARWSDGTSIVAADFVRSWLRMLDLNAEYATFFDIIKGAKAYREGTDRNPAHVGIRSPEERVLEVHLVRPVAYFTRLLCHQSFSPVHGSLMNEMDWRSKIPYPVNGPYVPVSMSETELILEKNPYYWDAASVHISRLRMSFSDNDEQATSLFNTGHVHWLAGPGNFDQILIQSAIQVFPIFSTHYWFFNCRQKPWDDQRIRRALALLLPWDTLRSTDLYRLPAKTLVLPLPGYSKTKGIERSNRDEAMALLAEAGYPNGKGLPPITIAFADYERPKSIAEIMKTTWQKELNITVNLTPMKPAVYYETIGSRAPRGDFTLAHETWIGDFADPEAFLQMWTTGTPLNIAGYRDSEFMNYMEQSYSASDESRMLLLSKAETVLLQGGACLPIYHNFAFSVIDTDYIKGWYQNALDIHPYKYLEFGNPSISPNVADMRSTQQSAYYR